MRARRIGMLFAIALSPGAAGAQPAGPWAVGASASAGLFVGSASDFLDAGSGLDLTVWRGIAPHLALRADGMLVLLEAQESPSETADNRVVLFGVGPDLDAGFGPLAIYARGLVGVAGNLQVRTNSPLEERTTWASAFGGGAGLRVRLAERLALDAGGDILKLGELDFARTATSSLMLLEDPALLRLRVGLRWSLPGGA